MILEPVVSVIVPNYNHALFLKDRLESIFNQSFRDFEVILLDDASTDGSVEVLQNYDAHSKVSHFIINEVNSGSPFKQWNKGVELAKGKYVWIAESDDTCTEAFLNELLIPLENDKRISLAFCQSHSMNRKGVVIGNWIDHTKEFENNLFKKDFVMDGFEFIEKFLIHKNVIPNVSAVLFRKDNLEEILPLSKNLNMKYYADWYYYVQLLCNSKVTFNAKSLNFFRYHDKSVIANAGKDSGWLKIFKMELEGRKTMIQEIKKNNPKNIKEIKKQSRIGDNKLNYWIAKEYFSKGNIFRAFFIVLFKPVLLKKLLIFISRNFAR